MPTAARHPAAGALVAIVVAATLLACSRGAERDPAIQPPTVRDSAGVQIVEHGPVGGAPPAFRLGEPTLVLGGVRERLEEEFAPRHPWTSAVRLSDGSIVVNDAVQLKFFDAAGTLRRAVGRKGRGPGEFRSVRELCVLPGDTLLAIEYSADRLSYWGPDGTHLRTERAPGRLPFGPCFADGTLLLQTRTTKEAMRAEAAGERTHPYARVRRDGTPVAELGRLPASDYRSLLFREVSVVAGGDVVHVADARSYEVRTLGADGRLVRILRAAEPPVPYTDAEWEQDVRRLIPGDVQGPQRACASCRARPAIRRTRACSPTRPGGCGCRTTASGSGGRCSTPTARCSGTWRCRRRWRTASRRSRRSCEIPPSCATAA